jgi:hypothetical protein
MTTYGVRQMACARLLGRPGAVRVLVVKVLNVFFLVPSLFFSPPSPFLPVFFPTRGPIMKKMITNNCQLMYRPALNDTRTRTARSACNCYVLRAPAEWRLGVRACMRDGASACAVLRALRYVRFFFPLLFSWGFLSLAFLLSFPFNLATSFQASFPLPAAAS